jgi:hypothetical protein
VFRSKTEQSHRPVEAQHVDSNYVVLTYSTIGDTILRLATVDVAQHKGRRNFKEAFHCKADQ